MERKNRSTKGKKSVATKRRRTPSRFIIPVVTVLIAIAVVGTVYFVFSSHGNVATSTSDTSAKYKWKILYVNQGNGLISESNFAALLSTVKSHGFNTIFFQVYRSGTLIFTVAQLEYFVSNAHSDNVSIFFALYFTNSTQQIPSQIYDLSENGISLDMSALPSQSQQTLFSELNQNYHGGKTAITTTNFALALKPDLLILETYDFSADKLYVHSGIIAGVEALATQNLQDYQMQYNYDLNNSDGVMVFDYYGLTTKGY